MIEKNSLKINIVGDFCSKNVSNLKFGRKLDLRLKEGNLNVVNFEAPISIPKCNPSHKSGPHLSQSVESPSFLEKNGFNVISLANNHILDYGEEAAKATIKAFNSSTILGIGNFHDAYEARYLDVHGIRIGLIAIVQCEFGVHVDESFKNELGVAWMCHPYVDEQIIKARKECDYLIVIPHAGLELFDLPLPELKSLYRHFIDMGADAVIGGHPHVPQCWEIYKEHPIVYSLGNFCFDDNCIDKLWYFGLIAELICKDGHVSLIVELIHYDAKNSIVELSNNAEILVHIEKVNKLFKNEEKYLETVNKHCIEMLSTYRELNEMSGYFKPNFKKMFRLILSILKRKILKFPELAFDESHYINNIRCEPHRWVQSRIFELTKTTE